MSGSEPGAARSPQSRRHNDLSDGPGYRGYFEQDSDTEIDFLWGGVICERVNPELQDVDALLHVFELCLVMTSIKSTGFYNSPPALISIVSP